MHQHSIVMPLRYMHGLLVFLNDTVTKGVGFMNFFVKIYTFLTKKFIFGILMLSGTLGVTNLLFLPQKEKVNVCLLVFGIVSLWTILLLYLGCIRYKRPQRIIFYFLLSWLVIYGLLAIAIMIQLS